MSLPNASADQVTTRGGWTALAAGLLLSLLLVLAGCSDAQDTIEGEPYPLANPLFYELANADGEVEGWLLGTIHALPDGVSWRTPAIERASQEADILAVEVANLGQSDAIRQVFIELSQSPGLAPLDERVSPELRPYLDTMIARMNTSRAILRTSEDWAVAIMLARVDAPGSPENGVDRALIAEFGSRRVLGLETAQSQLGIFDALAAEDQRELLEGTITEWADSNDNPHSLMRSWLTGDIAALEAATTQGIMADPELREALLVGRNRQWMQELTPLLEDDPKPLIAVGAAHLVGPKGLVAMFEEAGYTARLLPASQSRGPT